MRIIEKAIKEQELPTILAGAKFDSISFFSVKVSGYLEGQDVLNMEGLLEVAPGITRKFKGKFWKSMELLMIGY